MSLFNKTNLDAFKEYGELYKAHMQNSQDKEHYRCISDHSKVLRFKEYEFKKKTGLTPFKFNKKLIEMCKSDTAFRDHFHELQIPSLDIDLDVLARVLLLSFLD